MTNITNGQSKLHNGCSEQWENLSLYCHLKKVWKSDQKNKDSWKYVKKNDGKFNFDIINYKIFKNQTIEVKDMGKFIKYKYSQKPAKTDRPTNVQTEQHTDVRPNQPTEEQTDQPFK